jgi:hypothetical protein
MVSVWKCREKYMNYCDLQMELSWCLYGNVERNTRMDYWGQDIGDLQKLLRQ